MEDKAIPKVFWDSETGQLHRHCKVCERELLESQSPYAIQKLVKRYPPPTGEQVLFDFAICGQCMGQSQAKMSADSRRRVTAYLQQQMAAAQAPEGQWGGGFWEGRCALTKRPLAEMQEYQMALVCQGSHYREEPMLLSDEALAALQELLSPETKEEMDRFKNENFGWPPELTELWSRGELVLL